MKKITLFLALTGTLAANAQFIYTFAGNGIQGFSGDGGTATRAEFFSPQGVAADRFGNVYISDSWNNRIRKVNRAGEISTVAGTYSSGYSGDGNQGILAELSLPSGLTADSIGNLYIADQYNFVIRKLSPFGVIRTIAGNGTQGSGGDSLYACQAQLNYPGAITLDKNGNLFIADQGNNKIREAKLVRDTVYYYSLSHREMRGSFFYANQSIDFLQKNSLIVDTFKMFTVAGTGIPGYSNDGDSAITAEINIPSGVAVDTAGAVYIADYGNNCIRKVNRAGVISTIAGNGTAGFSGDGGPARAALLNGPTGLLLDAQGNLYISDANNVRIRKINTSGIISTVAGNGTSGYSGDGAAALSAQLNLPGAMAFDSIGNLFFCDQGNNVIRVITAGSSTGISPLRAATDQLQAYPNPTSTLLNVSVFASRSGEAKLVFTNMLGQTLSSELIQVTSGKNIYTKDLSGFSKGIYLLQVVSDNGLSGRIKVEVN